MGRLGPGLARGMGLGDDAAPAERAGYVGAYDEARAAGDVEGMAEAALKLAATQTFGTFPGRVPAFLHEAYSLARGEQRARLAVELARAWAYGYDPARAAEFAAEAFRYAKAHGDLSLLAAALDAQLLVHWGPDDLDKRLSITARLEDTVAHVTDVEPRMSAHLWRLTTALECLDLPAVRRQLRALDLLAAESGSARARFFAAWPRSWPPNATRCWISCAPLSASAAGRGCQARPASERALPSGRRSLARLTGSPPLTRRWEDCCPTRDHRRDLPL